MEQTTLVMKKTPRSTAPARIKQQYVSTPTVRVAGGEVMVGIRIRRVHAHTTPINKWVK